MKIGIVTCFNMKNVNYGNRLQAFALNRYLRDKAPGADVETIRFADFRNYIRIKDKNILLYYLKHARDKLFKNGKTEKLSPLLEGRLKAFNEFSTKTTALSKELSLEDFKASDYDVLITGSDIVWYQKPNIYRPVRFLDYDFKKSVRRIAYAASLGTDSIPESNKKHVLAALRRFDAISVREKSSVSFLKGLGIENVTHCVDPTLLVEESVWHGLEKEVLTDGKPIGDYIFVYLLGNNKKDREAITEIASKMGLKVVCVPLARGYEDDTDDGFGDVRVMDCSPEEWMWLIHNSRYFVTDSFHGVVFSTIFKTPFVVVGREEFGINNRISDFLKNIGQEDKFIKGLTDNSLTGLSWDYDSISARIENMKTCSEEFLRNALPEVLKQ